MEGGGDASKATEASPAAVASATSKDKKKMSQTSLRKKQSSSKGILHESKQSLKKGITSSQMSEMSSISLSMRRQSEMVSKGPRYQNTFRLEPKSPFKPDDVHKILANVVEREIQDMPAYDTYQGSRIAQTIASDVRTHVKQLQYDRYKIFVIVYIGERKMHGFQAAFRCLWDCERDGWSSYYFQCRTYFVSCTCYGLYHD